MALEIDLPLTSDAEADAEAAGLAAEVTDLGTERFLHAVLARPARIHHRSTERLIGLPTGVPAVAEPSSSLLLRALHLCFAAHLPLSLSPDVLWYTVVHESAVHVRLNADRYAHLFTDTPGYTRTIVVRDDAAPADWERSIRRVREPLHRNLGEATTELFLPPFSTTTPTDTAAALVALMDVVSPYYRFRWVTMCGIPRVRLEGTPEDWQLLADRTRALGERLTGLRPWLAGLLPVLDEIAATAAVGGPTSSSGGPSTRGSPPRAATPSPGGSPPSSPTATPTTAPCPRRPSDGRRPTRRTCPPTSPGCRSAGRPPRHLRHGLPRRCPRHRTRRRVGPAPAGRRRRRTPRRTHRGGPATARGVDARGRPAPHRLPGRPRPRPPRPGHRARHTDHRRPRDRVGRPLRGPRRRRRLAPGRPGLRGQRRLLLAQHRARPRRRPAPGLTVRRPPCPRRRAGRTGPAGPRRPRTSASP
ncbi:DUF4419 domain-containing protein [Kitasatospora arboriphila]